MISEQQNEMALRFVMGELNTHEQQAFTAEVLSNVELQKLVHSLQLGLEGVARAVPQVSPPSALKGKILKKIQGSAQPELAAATFGLRFLEGSDTGWKALPIPGAFLKLLSLQPDRGYAVLLGKLLPGTRYPAHTNVGPEDFYILTGDLHVDGRRLGPGDFHHAEAGSVHGENYSVEGCTLLAVLTTADPLVEFATK
jgi:quercetin dioxygenase-like cupin family protein